MSNKLPGVGVGLKRCMITVMCKSLLHPKWNYINRESSDNPILRNDMVVKMNDYLFTCLEEGPPPDDLVCTITEQWERIK